MQVADTAKPPPFNPVAILARIAGLEGSVAAPKLLSDYRRLSDVIANKSVAREGEKQ